MPGKTIKWLVIIAIFAALFNAPAIVSGQSALEIFPLALGTSSVSTIVHDSATGQPVSSPLALNSTVYDSATVTHSSGPTATGTVTYTFYRSGDCTTGTIAGTQVVTLTADGSVPSSSDHGPLTAADSPYAFRATFSGDANYFGATSDCEPFSVAKGAASISTTVYDASTNQPISGQLPLDATVFDTSTITHPAGPVPTGTVTYTFYRSGTCTTGIVVGSPQVVTLNQDGSVPHSANHGPLTAADGPYAFKAVYSGDNNYLGAASACEPLEVAQGPTSVTTVIYDASTSQPAPALLPLNSTVYDTSVVHHAGGPAPTGTVTYTFFRSGDCSSGTVTGTQVVTLNANGSVPNSADHGPLTAADSPYAFRATYSGDSNYTGGASDCEPFAVSKGSSSISTVVYDAATNQPVSGPLALHATIYDTATLAHSAGPIPTGVVTYTFYKQGTCTSGTVAGTQVVTLNPDGSVPRSADYGPLTATDSPYAFGATFSGDANYFGATSDCEPLIVIGLPYDHLVYLPLVAVKH